MLHSQLATMPIVQSPNPNRPYLLFMDVSKFCYSSVLTQTSTEDSNEALMKLLTNKDPLKSVRSKTQDLHLKVNVIYPVAYISGSFSESQCRWHTIMKEYFSVYVNQKNVPSICKMPIY